MKIRDLYFDILLISGLLIFSMSCENNSTKPDITPNNPAGTFQLSVSVKDSNGEPVPDASVVIDPTILKKINLPVVHPVGGGSSFTVDVYQVPKRYLTDANGSVVVNDLPFQANGTTDAPVYVNQSDIEYMKELDYSVHIIKSGYSYTSVKIGTVDQAKVNVTGTSDKESDALDLGLGLLDYQVFKAASQFLVSNKIKYTDLTGKLLNTDLSQYKILAVGIDASLYVDRWTELIGIHDITNGNLTAEGAQKIKEFVDTGGTLVFFQQDDKHHAGFFNDKLVPGAYGLAYNFFELTLLEDKPDNDFSSGEILDYTHPLITGAASSDTLANSDLENWDYSIVWKAGSDFTDNVIGSFSPESSATQFNRIIGAPGTSEAGSLLLTPNQYTVALEIQPSSGTGYIFYCQSLFVQATIGATKEPKAAKLAKNFIHYLRVRAGKI